MEDKRTQFTMRINTVIWDKIKALAANNKRSAVKKVEFILENHLKSLEEKEK